jgi:AcrR family transcriptional regulator
VKKPKPRPYTQKKRAEAQTETRRRIIESVVGLHEEVGPARTTVVEIAERANVSRPTVYSHFPDERSLITACAAHWAAANPPPDPMAWATIADPAERLRVGLSELYAYYEPRERMIANVIRDAPLTPSLAEAAHRTFGVYLDAAVTQLEAGRKHRRPAHAALRLALDFHTWHTLSSSGLTSVAAAELMATLVEAASAGRSRAPGTP